VSDELTIRAARPDDVAVIHALILELAEYERARDQVSGTPEMLETWLFGASPAAEAVLAERDGEVVGFALFHGSFSTWECLPGLWLEDLYVPPHHRRGGVGEALLRHLAAVAVERGYSRLEWTALQWNTPALSFYEKLGAEVLREWQMHRLSGEALEAVAGRARNSA
jgi:GNAT superfamily N-acetyltransferase